VHIGEYEAVLIQSYIENGEQFCDLIYLLHAFDMLVWLGVIIQKITIMHVKQIFKFPADRSLFVEESEGEETSA
jgi:hypothetical protein